MLQIRNEMFQKVLTWQSVKEFSLSLTYKRTETIATRLLRLYMKLIIEQLEIYLEAMKSRMFVAQTTQEHFSLPRVLIK